jgi:hypothetical protein
VGEWVRAKGCSTNSCIEVKNHGAAIEIRNGEVPGSQVFTSFEEWRTFVEGIKNGDFDSLL